MGKKKKNKHVQKITKEEINTEKQNNQEEKLSEEEQKKQEELKKEQELENEILKEMENYLVEKPLELQATLKTFLTKSNNKRHIIKIIDKPKTHIENFTNLLFTESLNTKFWNYIEIASWALGSSVSIPYIIYGIQNDVPALTIFEASLLACGMAFIVKVIARDFKKQKKDVKENVELAENLKLVVVNLKKLGYNEEEITYIMNCCYPINEKQKKRMKKYDVEPLCPECPSKRADAYVDEYYKLYGDEIFNQK